MAKTWPTRSNRSACWPAALARTSFPIRRTSFAPRGSGAKTSYALTPSGEIALLALGIDVAAARKSRRRFAYACVDWSERRPHLGGAIGAALLHMAVKKKWVVQSGYSRALDVTLGGRRQFNAHFGLAAY